MVRLRSNSQTAINVSQSRMAVLLRRVRHLELRVAFLQHNVEAERVESEFSPGQFNCNSSDVLKALRSHQTRSKSRCSFASAAATSQKRVGSARAGRRACSRLVPSTGCTLALIADKAETLDRRVVGPFMAGHTDANGAKHQVATGDEPVATAIIHHMWLEARRQ